MATTVDLTPPGKFSLFSTVGAKRRRIHSAAPVPTTSMNTWNQNEQNGSPPPLLVEEESSDMSEEKTRQTSKCKGATPIPIFLKKTYKMVDTCDPNIASWTVNGDMFVVKDPDMFASTIIPQYFDHNKFSSFGRQLNFYGFRKMQSKPIRNSDFDAVTAKHVTFYNENFKRGRCDLLNKIQRSTRGGGNNMAQDHQREIQTLEDKVSGLEHKITDMNKTMEERFRLLELNMLGRMEKMILAMHQQQRTPLQLQNAAAAATAAAAAANISGIPP